jgi:hypothetical protein
MAYSYTVTLVNNSSVHTIGLYMVVPLRDKSDATRPYERFDIGPLDKKVITIEASSQALNGVHAAIFASIIYTNGYVAALPHQSYWRWEQDGEVVSSLNPARWMFLVTGDTTITLFGGERPQALKLLCRSDGKLLYAEGFQPIDGLALNNASLYIECTNVVTASRTLYLNFTTWCEAFGHGSHSSDIFDYIYLSQRYGSTFDGGSPPRSHTWSHFTLNDGHLMGADGVRPVIVREPAMLVCILPWCYEYLNDGINPTGIYPQSWRSRTYRMVLEGGGTILGGVPKMNGPFFGLYDWRARRWLARVCPSIDGALVNESL